MVRQGIARGCQTYIIREGWEGLVRGNTTEPTPAPSAMTSPHIAPKRSVSFSALPPSQQLEKLDLDEHAAKEDKSHGVNYADPKAVAPLSDAPLSFGFGELLKDGAGEGDVEEQQNIPGLVIADEKDELGKSLRGRYIVRVGWDDVRGWLGEGGTLIGSSRCPACKSFKMKLHVQRVELISVREREGRLKAAENLIKFGIDCLAVCGGDGSLTGADKLRGEWPSLVEELHSTGTSDTSLYIWADTRPYQCRTGRGLRTPQHRRSRRFYRVS